MVENVQIITTLITSSSREVFPHFYYNYKVSDTRNLFNFENVTDCEVFPHFYYNYKVSDTRNLFNFENVTDCDSIT
jgi:uncharacterized protein (DUF952 family)